jgi:hypothetical protein
MTEGVRRVDRPAGTKVSERDERERESARSGEATPEAPAKPPQATEPERVVTIPEAEPAAKPAPEAPRGEPSGKPPPTPAAPTERIPTTRKAEPAPKTPRFSPSRLVAGGLLILGGIAWLLDVTNATNVNWGVLLSVALMGAGGGLVLLGLRGGSNRGLVVLGVILAAILTAAATLRIDIAGGIGTQTVHPASAKALGKTYRLAIGQMTIDLRHVSFHKGSPKVKATVGMGQLVVLVPDGANVRVHARAGAGMVSSFNHSESGLDVDHTFNHGPGPPTVILDLSVGLGQVTVHK